MVQFYYLKRKYYDATSHGYGRNERKPCLWKSAYYLSQYIVVVLMSIVWNSHQGKHIETIKNLLILISYPIFTVCYEHIRWWNNLFAKSYKTPHLLTNSNWFQSFKKFYRFTSFPHQLAWADPVKIVWWWFYHIYCIKLETKIVWMLFRASLPL